MFRRQKYVVPDSPGVGLPASATFASSALGHVPRLVGLLAPPLKW
jgi:hypothetical protein